MSSPWALFFSGIPSNRSASDTYGLYNSASRQQFYALAFRISSRKTVSTGLENALFGDEGKIDLQCFLPLNVVSRHTGKLFSVYSLASYSQTRPYSHLPRGPTPSPRLPHNHVDALGCHVLVIEGSDEHMRKNAGFLIITPSMGESKAPPPRPLKSQCLPGRWPPSLRHRHTHHGISTSHCNRSSCSPASPHARWRWPRFISRSNRRPGLLQVSWDCLAQRRESMARS
jgi:hypothetical protein